MKIDNTELWSGLVGLALSIFVVWSGYSLKLGTINDPGSGYVMFYAGLLMVVFSLIILYGAVKEGGPTFLSLWRDVLWTKPLLVIALLVAFTLVFETLGFLRFDDDPADCAVARHRSGAVAARDPDRDPRAAHLLVRAAEASAHSAALGRPRDRVRGGHGNAQPRRAGFRRRTSADQSAVLFRRRLHRHAGRRAAGHRSGLGDVAAAAGDARRHAGIRHHHDGRHLLWLHVRRIDHVDPRQHSGRGRVGGDVSRRSRNGEARPRRSRARHLGARLVSSPAPSRSFS